MMRFAQALQRFSLCVPFLLLDLAVVCQSVSLGGVVVLANRGSTDVDFTIVQTDGSQTQHRLAPRDLVPIPAVGRVGIGFNAGNAKRQFLLNANSIYYFLDKDDRLELTQLTFGKASGVSASSASQEPDAPTVAVYTIPVKLLTDDEEPAVKRLWEARLRRRLAEASEIIERHCNERFEVVGTDTWDSDDGTDDFHESLREFEREVDPSPARLAIGFTSQYKIPDRREHLGATRGPFRKHILIREWSQHISASERLEVLLHELGHFLGAVHSAEHDSVMRPILGDRRARAREFRIGFDPVNTMIMYLIGQELRRGTFRGLSKLPSDTKAHLRSAYQALAETTPDDPTADKYIALMSLADGDGKEPIHYKTDLVGGTRSVVAAILRAAERNHRAGKTPGVRRLTGDELTEHYVRRAAAEAAGLPADSAADAFLLGVGISLDHSTLLRELPLVAHLCRQVEPDDHRRRRLAALGSPTMRGRRDLAQHFAVCCALTVVVGPQGAESAGLLKELQDSREGSGFSFADLAADLAGVAFATSVRTSKTPLTSVASSFEVSHYMPEVADLQERIPWETFVETFATATDNSFRSRQAAIRGQILSLPGYQASRLRTGGR